MVFDYSYYITSLIPPSLRTKSPSDHCVLHLQVEVQLLPLAAALGPPEHQRQGHAEASHKRSEQHQGGHHAPRGGAALLRRRWLLGLGPSHLYSPSGHRCPERAIAASSS